MLEDTYIRKAQIKRIIDGDTFEVIVDCGFRRYSVERLRLLGVNTPEVRGVQKEKGLESARFVEQLMPVGSTIVFRSVKADSFGRWLADVFYEETKGQYENLAERLIADGFGVEYKK